MKNGEIMMHVELIITAEIKEKTMSNDLARRLGNQMINLLSEKGADNIDVQVTWNEDLKINSTEKSLNKKFPSIRIFYYNTDEDSTDENNQLSSPNGKEVVQQLLHSVAST